MSTTSPEIRFPLRLQGPDINREDTQPAHLILGDSQTMITQGHLLKVIQDSQDQVAKDLSQVFLDRAHHIPGKDRQDPMATLDKMGNPIHLDLVQEDLVLGLERIDTVLASPVSVQGLKILANMLVETTPLSPGSQI